MNKVSLKYVRNLMEKDLREDNRKFDEYREISVERGVSAKSAEGSARVKFGDTEVIAGIKVDVGAPYSDSPDAGTLIVNAELIPLSSPEFESGPPSIDSIELSRVIDRGIRESGMLDFKKLCIKEGEKMWMVFIDIYPINDAGNLFDACFLAASEALKDAVFPKYDAEKEQIDYKEKTSDKMPLVKDPVSITVGKIGSKFILDGSVEEEAAYDSRLSVVIDENDKICAMQKGKEGTMTAEEVISIIDLVGSKIPTLRKFMGK